MLRAAVRAIVSHAVQLCFTYLIACRYCTFEEINDDDDDNISVF